VFPDAVFIKTRTQTFNAYHYYILYGGLIWHKSIDPATEPVSWTLFQETGLPHNLWKWGFHKPKKIVEISADADELVALSDEGGFYRYCFDLTIAHKSGVWLDRQGWPIEEQLFLDERAVRNKAWALGKRNTHVLYYEDPFGNQHHNGTMEIATTYMLLEDGQEIVYADAGLRSDFSRNYIGPERGAFKAVALSASASTLFVMNDAGEMYTRIADFDIVGCDPMFFKYTYVPYQSDLSGTNFFSNLTEWGLPAEDWRAQPPIPLDEGNRADGNRAALSRHITILQNGEGNGARELRVAGINADGETGYWTKAIFDEVWTFRAVPLSFAPGSLLPRNGERGIRGKILDIALRGFWWNGREKEEGTTYEIPDFNILEGECTLRIMRNGEVCEFTLYPVELWTYQKRDYLPGRTGLPKVFLGTISLDEAAFDGLSEAFAAFIRERFGKYDKKLFHYTITAAKNFFILYDSAEGNGEYAGFFLTDGTLSDDFRELADRQFVDYAEETVLYHAAALSFEHGRPPPQPSEIEEKIALNAAFRDRLHAKIEAEKRDKRLSVSINIGYLPLDGIIRVTPLQFIDLPKIYTMTRFGKRIVLLNSTYTGWVTETRTRVYQTFIGLVDARIASYTDILKQIHAGEKPLAMPPWFSERVDGYWDAAGLPHTIEGTFFSPYLREKKREVSASLAFRREENADPVSGWHLSIGQSPSYTLIVDPQKSIPALAKRKGKTPREQAVKIDCVLFTNLALTTALEKKIVEECLAPFASGDRDGIKVRIIFDGETFEIHEYPAKHDNSLIFRGKTTDKAF
jgi:hypothetical protein